MMKELGATKRATVKDVAALAGVGHPSVSVVLNGARSGMHVAPATRQRILEAAAELGYQPNTSARAMKTGRFGCVALLTSSEPHRAGVQSPLLQGIYDELGAHDLHLMLARLPDASLLDEAVVPRLLREWMVDGLLIAYNAFVPPVIAEMIQRHRVPSIWLNAEQESDCVRPGDEEGLYNATRHLQNLGHRRIAYVSVARPLHYSVAARERGYRRAMEEAGLATQVHEESFEIPLREKYEAVQSWLAPAVRPTAMVFYGGESATLTLHAAAHAGLRVPQDLSLLAVGEARLHCLYAVMDTLLIPFRRSGRSPCANCSEKLRSLPRFCRLAFFH
jgi:LacI family transcriptional regulator